MGHRNLFLTLGILLIPFVIVGYFVWANLGTKQNSTQNEAKSFSPQQKKIYTIEEQGNQPLDILATTLPQFAIKMIDKKFKNLWQAHAEEKKKLVTSESINAKGDQLLEMDATFDEKKKQVVLTPKISGSFSPGKYTMQMRVKTYTGEEFTIVQDFNWGVLALNTDKGRYTVGDTVSIGMSVLDDLGYTKCITHEEIVFGTAKVRLRIISPSGVVENLSTDDDSITGSKTCKDRSVTNNADFLAKTKASEVGTYKLVMEAQTYMGPRSMEYAFSVGKIPPAFEIVRTAYPTRIYPYADYPITIMVTANQDYSGPVSDFVPGNFGIRSISNDGYIEKIENYQKITWNMTWKKGDFHVFSYTIDFPRISPEFYLVGPFTIGSFTEGNSWQIASDSIFSFIQERHNSGTAASISVSLVSTATPGDLLVLICSNATNTTGTFSTPSGWTSSYNNTGTSPRQYMFHRVVPASPAITSVTCTPSSNRAVAMQILEFAGNSSDQATVRSARNRQNTSSNCNLGSFKNPGNTAVSASETNPDVLSVSAFSSNNATASVSAHTSSPTTFVDTQYPNRTSFNGNSGGTFDSGWSESIGTPTFSVNDTVTYNQASGTCNYLIVDFNPTITVIQNGYRFFTAANSLTPGALLAAEDTPIILAQPNQQFRLRMLLDVDSSSGSSIPINGGDWVLQVGELPVGGTCASANFEDVATTSAMAYWQNSATAFAPPLVGGNLRNISSTVDDPSDVSNGYTTVLEQYMELFTADNPDNDISNNQNAMGNNQAGLFDFSLIDNTDDASSRTYCFKIVGAGDVDLAAYTRYPQVTTVILDVNIRGGSTIRGGTIIR